MTKTMKQSAKKSAPVSQRATRVDNKAELAFITLQKGVTPDKLQSLTGWKQKPTVSKVTAMVQRWGWTLTTTKNAKDELVFRIV